MYTYIVHIVWNWNKFNRLEKCRDTIQCTSTIIETFTWLLIKNHLYFSIAYHIHMVREHSCKEIYFNSILIIFTYIKVHSRILMQKKQNKSSLLMQKLLMRLQVNYHSEKTLKKKANKINSTSVEVDCKLWMYELGKLCGKAMTWSFLCEPKLSASSKWTPSNSGLMHFSLGWLQ